MTAALCVSCVKERIKDCQRPFVLSFQYTTASVENQDLFHSAMENATLFVYDQDDHMVESRKIGLADFVDGQKYELALPNGVYTMVVFGGVDSTYQYYETESWKTARVGVVRDAENENRVDYGIENLFHGMLKSVVINELTQQSEYVMPFIKNNNAVTVTIKEVGLQQENVGGAPGLIPNNDLAGNALIRRRSNALSRSDQPQIYATCQISAANGDYKFDNTVHGEEIVAYMPHSTSQVLDETHEFTILRIWQNDQSRLMVKDPQRVWYDGSLTELLLMKPNTDLEKEDDFDIVLTLDHTYGTLGITINDWAVIDQSVGIN